MSEYRALWLQELREQVLVGYGGQCECCKTDVLQFLCIDHRDGGGGKHRKDLRVSSAQWYRWIIDNDFPIELRVLCHNCNAAKGYYGKCPHEV